MNKKQALTAGMVFALGATLIARSRMSGIFADPAEHLLFLSFSGMASSDFIGMHGPIDLRYTREGADITLHQPNGNPTLQLEEDGTICCGPAGRLHPLKLSPFTK